MLSIRYFCCLKVMSTSNARYFIIIEERAKKPVKPKVITNIVVVQPSIG
jgi:hypothetical protein